MSKHFVVVYEAPADFTTATELADRVLVAEIGSPEESLLDSQRQWVGEDPAGNRLEWKSIPARAREIGIRVRGHFEGKPGLPDAKAARRAIEYVRKTLEAVDAILLIRDTDDQGERRQGIEQARHCHATALPIVVGVAVPERECWVLCGFEPEDDDERRKLATERQELGFDPRLRSHDLTAGKDDRAKRSPKRVLAALTGDSSQRQRECWRSTSLTTLKDRGQANGLTDYLDEVKKHLAPLIAGPAGEP